MSTLSVTNTFVNGNNADASQVNTNFTDVTSYVNTNCIVKDASLAFTNLISGPTGTDPTSDDHLARKRYVDDHDTKTVQNFPNPNGNYVGGTILSTIDVTDPGYDIDWWGLGSVITNPPGGTGNLSNIWELGIWANGTQKAGFRIPIVANQQSLSTGGSAVFTLTTGTGTGSGGAHRFQMKITNVGGVQANIFMYATDSRYQYLQIWYKRH